MTWQEDLHRKNQAEAAATRARINEGNARMQAENNARIARDAAERTANHNRVMENLRRQAPTYPSWSSPAPRIKKKEASLPYTGDSSASSSSAGLSTRTTTSGKKLAWWVIILGGILLAFASSKDASTPGFTYLVMFAGLCGVVLILYWIKEILTLAFKLALIGGAIFLIYLFFHSR